MHVRSTVHEDMRSDFQKKKIAICYSSPWTFCTPNIKHIAITASGNSNGSEEDAMLGRHRQIKFECSVGGAATTPEDDYAGAVNKLEADHWWMGFRKSNAS